MLKKITVLIVSLLISACAGHQTQVEKSALPAETNEVLEFLIDVQERNLRKSVEFCQNRKPEMNSAFDNYLTQYRLGAQAALQKIGRKESGNMIPESREIENFLALQDQQGAATLRNISANPAYGCGKLFTIFSVFLAEDAESQLLANYASYLEQRREYCSQIPVPDGCP